MLAKGCDAVCSLVDTSNLFDIMLVVVDGRERTEVEYRQLLEGSGLVVLRRVDTRSPISLLESEWGLSERPR